MKKLIIVMFLLAFGSAGFAEDKPQPPKEEKREPPVIVHKPGKDLAQKIREKLGLDKPRGLP